MGKDERIIIRSRYFFTVCLVVAGFLCLPVNPVLGQITIDDFTIGQGSSGSPLLTTTSVNSPPGESNTLGPASTTNIVGGYRHLWLHQTANSGSAESKAYVDSNIWNLSNDPLATGWGKVVWNGSSTEASFNLGLNLSNLSHFNIDSVDSELDSVFYLDIYTTDSQYGSRATFNHLSSVNPQLNIQITKGMFTQQIGTLGHADFSKIDRIEFYFAPEFNIDVTATRITAQEDNPDISCLQKRWTTDLGYNNLTSTLVLPQAPTFDGYVYVELTAQNEGAGSDNVTFEDRMPIGVTYDNLLQPMDGLTLRPGDPVITDAGQTLTFQSTTPMAGSTTARIRYRVHVNMTAPSSLENRFNAKAASESEYPQKLCPATISLTNPPSRVPSLNEWGMIILSLVLAGSAVWLLRRRRTS